jgi:hypothetical protein
MPKAHYTVTVQVKEVIPASPGTDKNAAYSRGQTPELATEREVNDVVSVTTRADTKANAVEKAVRMLEAEAEDDTDGQ